MGGGGRLYGFVIDQMINCILITWNLPKQFIQTDLSGQLNQIAGQGMNILNSSSFQVWKNALNCISPQKVEKEINKIQQT